MAYIRQQDFRSENCAGHGVTIIARKHYRTGYSVTLFLADDRHGGGLIISGHISTVGRMRRKRREDRRGITERWR